MMSQRHQYLQQKTFLLPYKIIYKSTQQLKTKTSVYYESDRSTKVDGRKRFNDGKDLIEMTGKEKEYKKNGVVSKLYEDN